MNEILEKNIITFFRLYLYDFLFISISYYYYSKQNINYFFRLVNYKKIEIIDKKIERY